LRKEIEGYHCLYSLSYLEEVFSETELPVLDTMKLHYYTAPGWASPPKSNPGRRWAGILPNDL
jgi:hypothetical protein